MAGIDRKRCPICGAPNECGAESGSATCWCYNAKIPAERLALVPPELRGKACICKRCALGEREPGETLGRIESLLKNHAGK